MLCNKLNAMSVGTLWVLRSQEESQFAKHVKICPEVDCCPICGHSWALLNTQQRAEESRVVDNAVLVVLAESITNESQQKLFEACMAAAGWNVPLDCFSLHEPCSSNSQTAVDALQEYIAARQPECIVVFGMHTAQLIDSAFIPGQIHHYANSRLIVTHHPEEMLNNPALKAQVWTDLCLMKVE